VADFSKLTTPLQAPQNSLYYSMVFCLIGLNYRYSSCYHPDVIRPGHVDDHDNSELVGSVPRTAQDTRGKDRTGLVRKRGWVMQFPLFDVLGEPLGGFDVSWERIAPADRGTHRELRQ
jgi:hypothetical protein